MVCWICVGGIRWFGGCVVWCICVWGGGCCGGFVVGAIRRVGGFVVGRKVFCFLDVRAGGLA